MGGHGQGCGSRGAKGPGDMDVRACDSGFGQVWVVKIRVPMFVGIYTRDYGILRCLPGVVTLEGPTWSL